MKRYGRGNLGASPLTGRKTGDPVIQNASRTVCIIGLNPTVNAIPNSEKLQCMVQTIPIKTVEGISKVNEENVTRHMVFILYILHNI